MSALTPSSHPAPSVGEVENIAIEAYIYLYPLLLMELTRRQMTSGQHSRPGFGPMGQFSHMREYPSAELRSVVRPNFDTLYSLAWLDLTHEPMVVSVPDTEDRYYLLPLYDMWTDAFAVPGKRTSGTSAADFAVLPPNWRGALPEGVRPIPAPTPYVWVIGRIQTNGPEDYPAVHAVQDGFTITPLSRWGSPPASPETSASIGGDQGLDPMAALHAMGTDDCFALAADLMKLHEPHVTDWSILARMGRIGLRPGLDFDPSALDDAGRQALTGVTDKALARMRAVVPTLSPVVDGWTTDTRTMGVYGDYYLKRAVIAMIGLGANQPEDAVYPLAVSDADGQPLTGEHDYVLHFDADRFPPAQAFWSVTMYDAEGFQVANPLGRFAIDDRDVLRFNGDGSLDLFLQHEHPGPDRESNWLPAPLGPLGITMRPEFGHPLGLRWVAGR